MTEGSPLLLARFLHYATLVPLVGMLLYGLHSAALVPAPLWERVSGRLVRPAQLLAFGALLSAAAWLAATLIAMAGSVEVALDPAIFCFVLLESDFGRLWLARLALAAVLVACLALRPRLAWPVGALLLVSLAGTGHTQINPPPLGLLHMASDAIHLLAAALWLGGLVPLALVLRESQPPAPLAAVLHRFSAIGYVAVAALAVTGTANLMLSAEAPLRLFSTAWGWLLAAKLTAFAAMLALAASNRFRLLAHLDGLDAGPEADALRERLLRHVWAEQALGLAILALVAALGMTALP